MTGHDVLIVGSIYPSAIVTPFFVENKIGLVIFPKVMSIL